MENVKVLHFAPGLKWGTIERQVLQDVVGLSKEGVESILYCSQNSALDIKSNNYSLDKLYHEGNSNMNITSLTRMMSFEKLILEKEIKVVHCYNILFLGFVVFSLRRLPQISIQFTINRELVRNYRKPFTKLLANRVDVVYLPVSQLKENIFSQTSIPSHKIQFLGLPIEKGKKHKLDPESGPLTLGAYFCPLEENYESLIPLLNAVKVIVEQRPELKIELKVFTDFELSNTFLAENIKTLLSLRELSDLVEVVKFEGLYPDMSEVDLWIEGNQHEEVQDFSVVALERGVSLVAVRKSVFLTYSHKDERRILTYKVGDSRELRNKILKFCDDPPGPRKKFAITEFHPENYVYLLQKNYKRQIERRGMFISRRRLRPK